MDIIFILVIIVIQSFILFLSITYSEKFNRRIITPVTVYIGVNTVAVFLFLLNLLPYNQLNILAFLILIISEVALMFGSVLGMAIVSDIGKKYRTRVCKDIKNINVKQAYIIDHDLKTVKLSLKIIGIVSTIGWIYAFINIMLSQYSISFLLQNPHYIGVTGITMQYLGYVNLLGIWVFPMYCYCYIKKKVSRIDFLFVLSAFLGLFLTGIKTYIIISLITGLFVYVHLSYKIKWKNIIITSIIILAFFIFYNYYIDPWVSRIVISGSKFPSILKPLEQPYRYLSGPFAGFSSLVSYDSLFPYKGFVVFSWVFKLLSFFNLFDGDTTSYFDSISIGSDTLSINVYTMVGEAYLDLGIFGILFLFFILGLITTMLFEAGKDSKNLVSLFVSSLLMYCLFISFFAYYLGFNILVLILGGALVLNISKILIRRKIK